MHTPAVTSSSIAEGRAPFGALRRELLAAALRTDRALADRDGDR